MSIICETNDGYVISHSEYINKVCKLSTDITRMKVKDETFAINTPYKTELQAIKSACVDKHAERKRKKAARNSEVPTEYLTQLKEATLVQEVHPKLINEAKNKDNFKYSSSEADIKSNNQLCREFASKVFQQSTLKGDVSSFHGGNTSSETIIATVQGQRYIIPPNCSFHCQDISQLSRDALKDDCPENGFDLVVVDPPWWNKYIRRRKASNQQTGYMMLRTEDLMKIKLDDLLNENALVAVWCTNCQGHIEAVHNQLFPTWGLTYVATWFWLKVDRSGTPVCNFSTPPGKQPFERIIFGRKSNSTGNNPKEHKVIVSIPSAIHSHKPPLLDVLKPYLNVAPQTLELFARSLLPGTVSWGLEVLKLQHEYLFCDDLDD